MRSYTMLAVRDVEASSAWYQTLLGARSGHGGNEFEMLMDGDELLLLLHHLDTEEHPAMTDPSSGGAGNGVLLYFYVDDVEAHHRRALELEAEVLDEPHVNPIARQLEFSLRDPDGYALTICKLVRS